MLNIVFSNAQNNSYDSKTSLIGSTVQSETFKELSGSQYKYKNFCKADVYIILNDGSIEYELNYNAFKDELEFIENEIIYTVTNPDKIIKVEINEDVLVHAKYNNYDQEEEGYFFELIDDYISLYRREIISHIASQKTFDNYGISNNDKYLNKTNLYYLSIYGSPLILINNKKALNKLFFNHPVLKSFLKEEKIKLNSEDDLKKLVTFLNDYDKSKMRKN
ncbi:MAG TPA: hypothetical protein DCG75_10940 [Bacteroidales bacterium]|nr:hypothetical protein [Bacteroidales bacterium]